MKKSDVLKVTHGFPLDYMVSSEVYSYHLVKELIKQNIGTSVFTRVENEFAISFSIYSPFKTFKSNFA
jgi:hypothetical protein